MTRWATGSWTRTQTRKPLIRYGPRHAAGPKRRQQQQQQLLGHEKRPSDSPVWECLCAFVRSLSFRATAVVCGSKHIYVVSHKYHHNNRNHIPPSPLILLLQQSMRLLAQYLHGTRLTHTRNRTQRTVTGSKSRPYRCMFGRNAMRCAARLDRSLNYGPHRVAAHWAAHRIRMLRRRRRRLHSERRCPCIVRVFAHSPFVDRVETRTQCVCLQSYLFAFITNLPVCGSTIAPKIRINQNRFGLALQLKKLLLFLCSHYVVVIEQIHTIRLSRVRFVSDPKITPFSECHHRLVRLAVDTFVISIIVGQVLTCSVENNGGVWSF